jgi:hypothetical protein
MTDVGPVSDPLSRLATPGERLGWIFRDRHQFRRRFGEPSPLLEIPAPYLVQRAETRRARMTERGLKILGVGGGTGLLFLCIGCLVVDSGGFDDGVGLLIFGGLLAVVSVFAMKLPSWAYRKARDELFREQDRLEHSYEQAMADWQVREAEHYRRQQAAVDAMVEWGAATPMPGARRIDVVGGTRLGWEALLTVFGGSLLATRGPVTLVDFTGDALCGELLTLATSTGRSVRRMILPDELDKVDFLAGLETRACVNVLVEAMYGDRTDASRDERTQAAALLTQLCAVLGDDHSVARIVAALRVLTDRSGGPVLSRAEVDRVLGLMPDEARRHAYPRISLIESYLEPLAPMGSTAKPQAAVDLDCLIAHFEHINPADEVRKDLIVQWMITQAARGRAGSRTFIVLGADDVHHKHLERLTAVCERGGIRLVLFFTHLRDHTQLLLGGGEVCFMRLGNQPEARQAAEFIGYQHRFVLTQLTRAVGESDTRGLGRTESFHMGKSESTSRGSTGLHLSGRTWSHGHAWSETRGWSVTRSEAHSTNWSESAATQRVYELTVEPTVLQALPDYALLMVKKDRGETVVQAVECNPGIVTLPRVTMAPLEYVPPPQPDEAVAPETPVWTPR